MTAADRYLSGLACWRAVLECSSSGACECLQLLERKVEIKHPAAAADAHDGAPAAGEVQEYLIHCQRRLRVIRAPRFGGSLPDAPAQQARMARVQIVSATGQLELDAPLMDENADFLVFENGHWVPLFGEGEGA